jgi:hypothetical protein
VRRFRYRRGTLVVPAWRKWNGLLNIMQRTRRARPSEPLEWIIKRHLADPTSASVQVSEGHACRARVEEVGWTIKHNATDATIASLRRLPKRSPLTSPRTRWESYLPPRVRGGPGRGTLVVPVEPGSIIQGCAADLTNKSRQKPVHTQNRAQFSPPQEWFPCQRRQFAGIAARQRLQ